MSAEADAPARDNPGEGPFYALAIAIVVLGLLGGFFGLPRFFRPAHSERLGKAAPSFALPTLTNGEDLHAAPGAKVALDSLRGRPVLLDYWATWCGPCQAEAPVIDRIYRRHKDRGLVVLGVNVNVADDVDQVVPWVRRKGLSFPILHDFDNSGSDAFGVRNLPTVVLVSREGKVLAIRTGVTSDEDLDRMVREAL